MSISENIKGLKAFIPASIQIIAVSKTQPVRAIMEAYQADHRLFGENRAQELVSKALDLPADIQWHFIGHLQKNKVRSIAPYVSTIQSIDSFELLTEVNKAAAGCGRIIDCLIQFHIAREKSKFGVDLAKAREILSGFSSQSMANIRIKGLMGMASFTEDEPLIRHEFRILKQYLLTLRSEFFKNDAQFRELSMGMSGDYKIAIEEGATIVRIGTTIFGDRTSF